MKNDQNFMININGEIFGAEQAKISVFDRGFLFGDSVYEVVRTYQGELSLWEEHFKRLCSSGSKIGLEIPFSSTDLQNEIHKTIDVLNKCTTTSSEFFIRLIVTRGAGGFTMDFSELTPPNLIVMVKQLKPYPVEWYQKGVRVILANIHRTTQDSLDPNIKSGNYLNNVMAYQEAFKKGAYDAVMLNHQGEITEATTSNIWIVKDGILFTPPLKAGILEGITRQKILQICKTLSLEVRQKPLYPQDLWQADECFLSSSSKELIPVVMIDDKIIGEGKPGSWTKKLHQTYLSEVIR